MGSWASWSIVHRKAARVFPDPVGAWIRVWAPDPIAFQPSTWAGVGAGKLASNQARVAGANSSRELMSVQRIDARGQASPGSGHRKPVRGAERGAAAPRSAHTDAQPR